MSELLAHFQDRRQEMIDLLTTMVEIESPTKNKAEVDKMGDFVETQYRALGAQSIERYAQTAVGDLRLAKWNPDAPGQPILFLVHMDTVLPLGTLAQRPVNIDADGRLFGPGALDMKGGIAVMLTALRALIERNELPERPIWALATGDEEIGSPYSRPIIEELAQQAGLVLVLEPGTLDGALKTARKGVAKYEISVAGRASHAGNAPEEGINAVIELAQQALKLHAMNDLKHGTSVSVTMTHGGSAGNVIPATAWASVDVRTLTQEAGDNVHDAILNLTPFMPGAEVSVAVKARRGPLENNQRMQSDFAQCRAIGERLGLTVRGESVGGGSDGNLTAALGVSTLDGLGPQGWGLHADDEHVIIDSLPRRAALVARILCEWAFD